MTRSAVVTGATGFVGSHLATTLRARGWEVSAIVRPGRDPARTAILQAAGVTPVAYDGRIATLQRHFEAHTPDVVFHLATLFCGEHRPDDIDPLITANVAFGTQLLEAMRLTGARRIVTTGTAWEHHENRDYSPVSLYAATKGAFAAILAYYTEVAGLRAITLDLTDTYGPGDPRPKLLRLLRDAARTGTPLSMNAGEPYIDLLHVSDAVEAFLVAADRILAAEGEAFERWSIRPDSPLQLRQLVAIVSRVLGTEIPVRWGGRPYRAREAFVPWTSGQRLPGWSPRVDLEDGLRTLE